MCERMRDGGDLKGHWRSELASISGAKRQDAANIATYDLKVKICLIRDHHWRIHDRFFHTNKNSFGP